jgi:hypothetical protein
MRWLEWLFYWLICNALIAFLDFSAGVFIVYCIGYWFNLNPTGLSFMIGGILAISPDFDVLYMYMKKGGVYGDHHQFLTHRPIIGLAIADGLGWLFGGFFWAVISRACLLFHYLHDTEGFGTGGGIAWFWPLSKKYWSPWRAVTPEKSLMAQNQNHQEWLENNWLAPNPLAIAEILTGCIFLMITAAGIGNWRAGMFFVIIVWLGAFLLWSHQIISTKK